MNTTKIKQIQRIVAEYYCINPIYITHKTRAQQWQEPKYIAMFLARKLTGASYRTLARYFNRDHSAVRIGVCNIEARMGNDPDLERDINELIGIITNRKAKTEKELFGQLRIELHNIKQAMSKAHDLIGEIEKTIPPLEKIVDWSRAVSYRCPPDTDVSY